VADAEQAAGAVGDGEIAVRHLHLGMGFAAQLPHRLDDLVMPPRLTGWLLHSPPPSVLNGSLPTPEIRLPSATNLPPSPFLQNRDPRAASGP